MTTLEFRTTLLRLRLSQGELARRMGVLPGTVSRWATGKLALPTYVIAYLKALERPETTGEI